MLTEAVIKKAIKEGKDVQLSDGNGRGAGRLVLRLKSSQNVPFRISKYVWYVQGSADRPKRSTFRHVI